MSNWFGNILLEVNRLYRLSLSENDLSKQISDYAKSRDLNEMLRNHFPNDISKWRAGGPLRGPSADLFLSFMAARYPAVQGGEVERQHIALRDTYKPRSGTSRGRGPWTQNQSLEMLKLLAKETKRRASGKRGAHSYWSQMATRINQKYAGYYALLRTGSDEGIRAELMALTQNPNHPQIVTVYWGCQGEFWTGDLLVNPTKFSGTLTRRSTDKLMEPVSLDILRTATRPGTSTLPPQLVLSGLVVGWSDLRDDALVCSNIALFQIAQEQEAAIPQADFFAHLNSPKWSKFSAEIEAERWKFKTMFNRRFKSLKNIVYKQQASDSLKFPLSLDLTKEN